MKNLRTAAVALTFAVVATFAALPTVEAGKAPVNGRVMQAAVPIPMCPPNDPNGCNIFKPW